MNKYFLSLLMLIFSCSLMAIDDAEKLLATWGVKANHKGDVVYQGSQYLAPSYWVSKPMPKANSIDYSRLPVQFKPLILYGQ